MGDNWWKYMLAFALGLTAGVVVCKSHKQLRNVCTQAIGGAADFRNAPAAKDGGRGESAADLVAEASAPQGLYRPQV